MEEVSPAVLPPFRRVLKQLQARGATLHSVSIPSTPLALSAYYVLASAEASSNLARFDGIRYGQFGPLTMRLHVQPCSPHALTFFRHPRQRLRSNPGANPSLRCHALGRVR